MLLHAVVGHGRLLPLLHSILLFEHSIIYLSFLLLRESWVVSSAWHEQCCHGHSSTFGACIYAFLLIRGVAVLDHGACTCSALLLSTKQFYRISASIYVPPEADESSSCFV